MLRYRELLFLYYIHTNILNPLFVTFATNGPVRFSCTSSDPFPYDTNCSRIISLKSFILSLHERRRRRAECWGWPYVWSPFELHAATPVALHISWTSATFPPRKIQSLSLYFHLEARLPACLRGGRPNNSSKGVKAARTDASGRLYFTQQGVPPIYTLSLRTWPI